MCLKSVLSWPRYFDKKTNIHSTIQYILQQILLIQTLFFAENLPFNKDSNHVVLVM